MFNMNNDIIFNIILLIHNYMLILTIFFLINNLYKKKYQHQHKDKYINYEIIKHQMFIIFLNYLDK